jgi:glycerol-3-phosphate dehydrogenase
MASRKSQPLTAEEITDILDEDDDNFSDLEVDDAEDEAEQVEVFEVVFNSAGEVIEEIHPRHIIQCLVS